MAQALPPRLERIEIPYFFHPSSFVALETCALSVLGVAAAEERNGLLAAHPTAYLGTLLHHVRAEVRAGRWGAATTATAAAEAVFDLGLDDLERILEADVLTRSLLPLREAVGRREWKRRTGALRSWALSSGASRTGGPPRELSLGGSPSSAEQDNTDKAGVGVERTISVEALRLRGRPDATIESPESLDILEYKTGKLQDADGKILEPHRVQVQLYGLMIESLRGPTKKVRLYLEQVQRRQVPWSAAGRKAIEERLTNLCEALPSGVERDADTLATPGTHCCRCRLRPVCGSYLDQAPRWWRGGKDHPRPLPLDIWGAVTQPVDGDELVTLRLLDPAGRRVRIDQVSRDHGIDGLEQSEYVWLFDLEASEDVRRHGEPTQARNFHEYPPGPRWRRARRLRVFSDVNSS